MARIYNKLKQYFMSALSQQELAIHCGKTTDSFKKLKSIYAQQANELKTKITFSTQSEIIVPFWTNDSHELVCTGIFRKNNLGEIVYSRPLRMSTDIDIFKGRLISYALLKIQIPLGVYFKNQTASEREPLSSGRCRCLKFVFF